MATWYEPQLSGASSTAENTNAMSIANVYSTTGSNAGMPGTAAQDVCLEFQIEPSAGSKIQYVFEVYNAAGQKKASIHGSGTAADSASLRRFLVTGTGTTVGGIFGTAGVAHAHAENTVVEGTDGGIPHSGLVVGSSFGPNSKVVLKVSGKTSGVNVNCFGRGAFMGRSGSYTSLLGGAGHWEVEIPLVAKQVVDGSYP